MVPKFLLKFKINNKCTFSLFTIINTFNSVLDLSLGGLISLGAISGYTKELLLTLCLGLTILGSAQGGI